MRPAVPAVVLLALCATACGPGATTPSPTATPTAVDPCLVGTWKAASITGSLRDPNGGDPISLTGGGGGVVAINADGTMRIDDSASQADTGTGSDGTVYTLTATGSGSGHIISTAGQLTVTLDTTAAITQTITRNGTVIASQKPTNAVDTYQCSRGHSLVITSGGGIVSTYVPAG